MMNLKTTAMLGNITRQGVSRQLMPLTNSKNSVLTLSQRTAAQGGNVSANAPSNPVRSFSSSQASRDNNNNSNSATHLTGSHPFQPSYSSVASFSANNQFNTLPYQSYQRLQGPFVANSSFPKEFKNKSAIPKYSQLTKDAWDAAINGKDTRAVFSYLQEMRHEGLYADSALSSKIIAQFLDMNNPKDAERALSMLVDCHRNQGRTLSAAQKNIYTALANDIANHSSDFSQALSLAKLLDRHGLLASSGFADGALQTYRQLKSSAGLDVVKAAIVSTADMETLLTLQSSLTKTNNRYRHLIEILLDAKEMNMLPSQEICSRVSLSFMKLNDYTGQLAWDTAVQEIYPGYRASVPKDMEEEIAALDPVSSGLTSSFNSNTSDSAKHHKENEFTTQTTTTTTNTARNNDSSAAIIRACQFGYAAAALEGIHKMVNQNQIPSPQAIADTIQVCAKREKERTTDYQQLFRLAQQSLDLIRDDDQKRAA
ncbi:hypothetical protein BGZ65_010537, partial [Modicella reniformis]